MATLEEMSNAIRVILVAVLCATCTGVVLVATQAFRNAPSVPVLVIGVALLSCPLAVALYGGLKKTKRNT